MFMQIFMKLYVRRFMSYRVNREKEKKRRHLSDNAENHAAVASAGSSKSNQYCTSL